MRADPDDPLGQRQDRMAGRNAQSIEADRELSAIVQGAYENTLNFRARLGRIGEEIEQRVQNQDQALADSPMAVTEFHRFLLAKQKEIARLLADASADAQARRDRLATLAYRDNTPDTP